MNYVKRFFIACWSLYARLFSWCAGAALSNRGLTFTVLVTCLILITGPWLRSSVSRDFRGPHIPWNNSASSRFLPEYVAKAPREWRVDSIAIPMLAIVLVAIPVAFIRPRWMPHLFGLLIAVSIPALAVTLWNHPGLYEFFESEIRGRSMLRTVYRMEHTDLMTVRAPDRMQAFGGQTGKIDLLAPTHPLLVPLNYWMYGPWLVGAAIMGAVATNRTNWQRRFAYTGVWVGVGALFALAATWPRWVAEYHWTQAELLEERNDFVAAADALELARQSMPPLGFTKRYWEARGRLDYRQLVRSPYAAYFVSSEYLEAADVDRARNELAPFVDADSAAAPRALLAEIMGHTATGFSAHGKRGAAEKAWREAAEIAPWKPSYWVAYAVTVLGSAPERAPEIETRYLEELRDVGDCFVGSDFASALGDAYFESGDFTSARRLYSMAMDIFHLPKYVNLHAQEGRLGM
ncbi:hypothetical protein [Lacipirellula parvula]|uniref:Tetratricopeptide repeat protein n=1 Tax=Lacipirellula parvula TaxID=2650471 RepID=A0A5K7XBW2_9BACT|nr:hypothetical protein [Lacipirellula parvula]BBO33845.1 hypothetical protein PLANPX_3457 [Lacipirellula parvula]